MLKIFNENNQLIGRVVSFEVTDRSVNIHYLNDNSELTSCQYKKCDGEIRVSND